MESLAGYVEHIIYRNADNGYTVLNLVSGEDEITCVGIFSAIAEGENIEAQGEYTEHPTYGQQFKVTSFEEKAPEDEEAIERYLGSGAIKGIGLAMAARIVRRFKEDTFRIDLKFIHQKFCCLVDKIILICRQKRQICRHCNPACCLFHFKTVKQVDGLHDHFHFMVPILTSAHNIKPKIYFCKCFY